MNFIAHVGVCGPQSFGISTYTIDCAEWTMYTMRVYTIQSKLYILWKSTMGPGATTWSIHVNTDYVSWLTAILMGHFLLMWLQLLVLIYYLFYLQDKYFIVVPCIIIVFGPGSHPSVVTCQVRCAPKWGKRSEQPTTNTKWQQLASGGIPLRFWYMISTEGCAASLQVRCRREGFCELACAGN